MYSFNSIWRRIRSLQRRLAKDLAIIRLRRLAEDFCDDYEDAVNDDPPASHLELDRMGSAFIPSIGKAGFRLSTFMALRKYLERCLDDKRLPEPRDIVGSLLPWAAEGGFLRASLWHRDAEA